MKKLNLIIGKRQIVIVALLITLSVAAFLNWQFATGDQAVTVDLSNQEKQETSQNYGDAELVTKNEKNIKRNFIKQAKLDKDKSFDERIQNNSELINNPNLSQEDVSKIVDDSMKLTDQKNKEDRVSQKIKNDCSDFIKDCVTYKDERGNVSIHVASNNLNEEQVAKLADIAQNEFDVETSKITIIPSTPAS